MAASLYYTESPETYTTDTLWTKASHTGSVDLSKIEGSKGHKFHYSSKPRQILPVGSNGGAFGGNKNHMETFVVDELKSRLKKDADDPAAHGYSQFIAKHEIERLIEDTDEKYSSEYKRWLHGDSAGNNPESSPWGCVNIAQFIPGADSYISDEIEFRKNIQLFLCRLYIDGPPVKPHIAEWYFRYLVHPYTESRRLLSDVFGPTGSIAKSGTLADNRALTKVGYFTSSSNIVDFSEAIRGSQNNDLIEEWPKSVLDGDKMPGGWRVDSTDDDDHFSILRRRKHEMPACLDPAVNPLMQMNFDVNLIRFPDKGKGKDLARILRYAGGRNTFGYSPFSDHQYHDVDGEEKYDPQGNFKEDKYGRMVHDVVKEGEQMKARPKNTLDGTVNEQGVQRARRPRVKSEPVESEPIQSEPMQTEPVQSAANEGDYIPKHKREATDVPATAVTVHHEEKGVARSTNVVVQHNVPSSSTSSSVHKHPDSPPTSGPMTIAQAPHQTFVFGGNGSQKVIKRSAEGNVDRNVQPKSEPSDDVAVPKGKKKPTPKPNSSASMDIQKVIKRSAGGNADRNVQPKSEPSDDVAVPKGKKTPTPKRGAYNSRTFVDRPRQPISSARSNGVVTYITKTSVEEHHVHKPSSSTPSNEVIKHVSNTSVEEHHKPQASSSEPSSALVLPGTSTSSGVVPYVPDPKTPPHKETPEKGPRRNPPRKAKALVVAPVSNARQRPRPDVPLSKSSQKPSTKVPPTGRVPPKTVPKTTEPPLQPQEATKKRKERQADDVTKDNVANLDREQTAEMLKEKGKTVDYETMQQIHVGIENRLRALKLKQAKVLDELRSLRAKNRVKRRDHQTVNSLVPQTKEIQRLQAEELVEIQLMREINEQLQTLKPQRRSKK